MHTISNGEPFHVSDIRKPPGSHVAMVSKSFAQCNRWWHHSDEERKLTVDWLCTQFFLSSVVTDRFGKQRNVSIFFLHNKSQCWCAVPNKTLLIICSQCFFLLQQTTSRPLAIRHCADIHCNNWNVQLVYRILWGDNLGVHASHFDEYLHLFFRFSEIILLLLIPWPSL